MSRPAFVDLTAGLEGWDAVENDNKDVLAGPYPIKEYANFAALAAVNPATYDRCVAATTDDGRLWISNGTQWIPIDGGSPKGAYLKSEFNEASSGALSGATYTFTNLIPAKSFLIGVSFRVTTLITGATTWDAGDGTDVDRFGAAIALAAGTLVDHSNATANPSGWFQAANNVVLTANGSNFTGGVVRACAHYTKLVAPQS